MQQTIGAYALALLDLVTEDQLLVARPPWWPAALPSPEVTVGILLGMFVVAAIGAVLFARVVVPGGVRLGQLISRIWNRITPQSTFGKVMVIFSILLLVTTGSTMFTLVDAKGAIQNVSAGTSTIAEMEGDAIVYVAGDDSGDSALPRPAPDRDGDRLLDDWERAGQTPDGVPLPNANAGRKDVYLQVLYGDGIDPLSASELTALREIWAQMPVENPDGSTGITLHVVDERRLDRDVNAYEPDKELIRARYDADHLGGATCVYYQTTFGEIEHPNLGGRGALGGYVSIVDGTETTARTGQTDRVAFLTHELLHNTAGRVQGRPHTEGGWLGPTYDGTDTELSPTTAAELESGFALGAYEERQVCGSA